MGKVRQRTSTNPARVSRAGFFCAHQSLAMNDKTIIHLCFLGALAALLACGAHFHRQADTEPTRPITCETPRLLPEDSPINSEST